MVDRLTDLEIDQAVVLTSFRQSPLPLALLLRMAGVPTIAAVSVDYPGSLLDVRHRVDDDLHEVERGLSLVATRVPAAGGGRRGAPGPAGAGRRRARPGGGGYVVVHPGASVPARAWAPERHAALVDALVGGGRRVVVTGSADERALTAMVAGGGGPGWSTLGERPTCGSWPGSSAGPRWWWSATPGRPTWRRRSECRWCRCSRRWCRPCGGGPGECRSYCSGTRRPDVPGRGRGSARCRASVHGWGPGGRGRGRGRTAGAAPAAAGGVRPEGCPGRSGGGGVRVLLWHVHGSWTTAFVQGRHEYLIPVTPDRGPTGWGGPRPGRGRRRRWRSPRRRRPRPRSTW